MGYVVRAASAPGVMAFSLIATRFYDNDLPAEQWAEQRLTLLKYCGLDTLSMVEILKVLYGAVEE